MGSSHSHLPSHVRQTADRVFDSLALTASGKIDRYQTLNLWLTPFKNTSALSILDKVDRNNDGWITRDEWMDFWTHIFNSGYSEQDIINQLCLIEQQKGDYIRYRSMPMGTTTIPMGTTTMPLGTMSMPMGTTTMPMGTMSMPMETTTMPKVTMSMPMETTTMPMGTTTMPMGTTTSVETIYPTTTTTTISEGYVDPQLKTTVEPINPILGTQEEQIRYCQTHPPGGI